MGTSTNANMELLTQNPLRALLDRADREYPMPVIVGHSLMSHIAFREWRGPSEAPHQFSWTHSLLASYLCTGNAGGWVSQMMLKPGEPEGSVRHPHVALAWVGAYLAVYWSPEDFMFKILSQKRNPLRLACMTMDTVDAYTTAFGRVDQALAVAPDAPFTPLLCGLSVFLSGSVFRHLEERGRNKDSKVCGHSPRAVYSRQRAFSWRTSCSDVFTRGEFMP